MRSRRVDRPNAGVVIGAAGCEVADIGGEEDACNVAIMGFEMSDGYEFGLFTLRVHSLVDTPDEYVALRGPNQ